jgi:hypothetical protein
VKYEGCLKSPKIDGYRNNYEFTVGHDKNGKICVGFLDGLYREGFTTVYVNI